MVIQLEFSLDFTPNFIFRFPFTSLLCLVLLLGFRCSRFVISKSPTSQSHQSYIVAIEFLDENFLV